MTAFVHGELKGILNQCMRDITKRFAGIELVEHDGTLSDDICTVHTVLECPHPAALLLCADTALLTKLAQRILCSQTVTQQDLEDVATEYFNVVCGKIVAGLFQAAKISSRFRVPEFRPGQYLPEKCSDCRCVVTFCDEDHQNAHLICAPLVTLPLCQTDNAEAKCEG